MLRLLVGTRFQVLFHSPLGVLFTFPSRYLFTIGLRRVFSLGGWSPRIHTGFHVSGITQVSSTQSPQFRIRGFNPLWPAFPYRFTTTTFCNYDYEVRFIEKMILQPHMQQRPNAQSVHGFRLGPISLAATLGISVDFSSSGYLDVSVLQVVSSQSMCSTGGNG